MDGYCDKRVDYVNSRVVQVVLSVVVHGYSVSVDEAQEVRCFLPPKNLPEIFAAPENRFAFYLRHVRMREDLVCS